MARLPKGLSKRADGRYMARFQSNGERFCVYGDTIKETQEKLEDLKFKSRHGMLCKSDNLTIDEWFTEWEQTYKQNTVKASTLDRYERTYNAFIKPSLGKIKVKDITPQMLQTLVNTMYSEHYSRTQINLCFVILNEMLTQAVKNGMLLTNPAAAITMPRFEKKTQDDRRVMTVEEQKIFLEYAACSTYYPFYQIALQTGGRINELLALQWSDVDFDKKTIHISGTLVYLREQGKRHRGTPKTATSNRFVPMLQPVEQLLHDMKKKQLENRIALGSDFKEEQGLENMVFTYPNGGVFWDSDIRNDMKRIVKQINADGTPFEAITPHCLRHSFATNAARSGMPLQVLKTILGHSSLQMTSDLYSHVLDDQKMDEMKKIENLF